MGDDVMRIDFGDGVSALDRVMRSITMMMAGAIAELEILGYDRNRDQIDVEDPNTTDGDESGVIIGTLPQWHVRMRGRRVFTVEIDRIGGLSIVGIWTDKPKKKTIKERLFGWRK